MIVWIDELYLLMVGLDGGRTTEMDVASCTVALLSSSIRASSSESMDDASVLGAGMARLAARKRLLSSAEPDSSASVGCLR